MNDKPNNRDYFDIGLVVPLEDELLQLINQFPPTENRGTDTVWCHVVESGHADVRMIVIQQSSMGNRHATNATQYLHEHFDIGLTVCLGIAGGISNDLDLADVCYSGHIADVLDNNKVVDIDDGKALDIEFSPTHYSTPTRFTRAFNFMRTQPQLIPVYDAWQQEREAIATKGIPDEVPSRGETFEQIGRTTTKDGTIVCGMVDKSALYNKKLKGVERALLAIETESGGVFSQAKFRDDKPAMTIRGISDYADGNKTKLEEATKGTVRKLAAANAASFLHLNITANPYFQRALLELRGSGDDLLDLGVEDETDVPLKQVMQTIEAEIDETLRRLSPEYKLQEKGYRLPVPRIRKTPQSGDPVDAQQEAIDVREVLKTRERTLINIPRSYPDKSLPWVVAADLLTCEIDGLQAVPIVIDGDAIRGKQDTFASAAAVDLDKLKQTDGVKMVFVVENMPFSSKHRIDTILEQCDMYPDARFLFVSRGDDALIGETSFMNRSAAAPYDAGKVSFLEIALFLEKNFQMGCQESEVIANRLYKTFDNFRLDAHPTYFAGIPKETLTALLNANRRSELIQLAVVGFLTFLVAGDQADINLGRTTRERFLRKLVVEMRLEKRNFDEAELVTFAKEFADRHDFQIKPLQFVNDFVDNGIMHFEQGRAQISLPFIESYLLAQELHDHPSLASRYFQMAEPFDYPAFELYAEIGASDEIVQAVIETLKAATDDLKKLNPGDNIMLSEEISPIAIRRTEATDRMRERLKNAAKAVREGSRNAEQKQQMLDVSEQVREEAGKQFADDDDEAVSKRFENLDRLGAAWTRAVVLLGQGAEHLEAKEKRDLSAKVVDGAAVALDEWSRINLEIDFDKMKENLTTDKALNATDFPDEIDDRRRFVGSIIDVMEYAILAQPIRQIFGYLAEQARHPALYMSVDKSEVEGKLETLIKASWMVDLMPKSGRKFLKESMKALPRASFLRYTIASHYLSRLFWAHWDKENRTIMLEAAQDVVKPLGVNIDKPKLEKLIKTKD
ncbi:hypothetical protein P8R33_12620 [Qipengyuania sp. XHP0211]|jgi:nucleoside phosphorylase|uniref:5'-methylthioadenosine/S-adenosylhomocysteine nucleosidase family protein n=1 Tax=Qipengyuania sp. XHP0211 TaxID=3038079 RepID=UPI00241DC2FA|nr:hypothetical protein [Qipengyuania sp. XHP0211]MDG5751954.1 hypothetical protein [Qipengyuania sp. XHP0211]